MNDAGYIPISDSESSDSPDDQEEFAEVKKADDPSEFGSKVGSNMSSDESDSCPICFDPWTSSGPHKLCCLRCGHLFGFSCVLKWIKSQGRQARCPQCNRKAVRHDIRFLYTKNLRAIDTSERDRALADLVIERKARRKAEAEAAEHKAKCQLLLMELSQLRDELQSVRAVSRALERHPLSSVTSRPKSSDSQDSVTHFGHFEPCKSVSISPVGNCRVLASCDYLNLLCVSQPSTNPIFRGFGIRKVHTIEQRPLKYIHLHQQPLRDLAFHPDAQDGILVSVSLDKTVRLTSLLTDQVVQTYHCESPVWSCCWASPNPTRFFAGCSNGSILIFDVRVTTGPLSTFSVPENNSPVIGLQYVRQNASSNATFSGGGLLVGQLTKVTFMKEDMSIPISTTRSPEPMDADELGNPVGGSQSPDLFQANQEGLQPTHQFQSDIKYTPHSLPLEGSLASLSLAPNGRHFLASYRPSQRLPRVRHLIAELVQEDSAVAQPESPSSVYTCNEVHSLWAGSRMKMLTRAKLFSVTGEDSLSSMLVAAGNEDVNGALIWRCDTGTRLQTLQPPETTADSPIIDCCSFTSTVSDQPHLVLLSERTLHLYQWIPGT